MAAHVFGEVQLLQVQIEQSVDYAAYLRFQGSTGEFALPPREGESYC